MPRHADPAERRAQVVEAAFRVLARDGLAGFSMRNVADEAGCTIGLVNHWFASKAEMVEAALDATAKASVGRANRIDAAAGDPFRRALLEYLPLDEVRRDEMRVRIAFWSLCLSEPALAARYRNFHAETRRSIALGLADRLSPAEAENAAERLLTTLVGVAVCAMMDPGHWTPELQRQTIDGVLRSIEP